MEPIELLKKAIDAFESLHIPYLITGSVASIAYGEPRLTNDVDIVAEITERQVGRFIEFFPHGDFYISEEQIIQAIRDKGQFNIIHPESGFKIDVIIKKNSRFDDCRFSRAHRIHPSPDYEANFAAPEDVIIKKMEFYKEGGSDKHLRDIAGILRISASKIDRAYITEWAHRLDLLEIWNLIQKRVDDSTRESQDPESSQSR